MKVAEIVDFKSFHHKRKEIAKIYGDMLLWLNIVIILQNIQVLCHYDIYLKLIHYSSIIPQFKQNGRTAVTHSQKRTKIWENGILLMAAKPLNDYIPQERPKKRHHLWKPLGLRSMLLRRTAALLKVNWWLSSVDQADDRMDCYKTYICW